MTNAGWNVLIYANADQGAVEAAMRDGIANMRGIALPADCNIAVQFNTATARERYWISNSQNRMELSQPVDTSTATALTSFIDDATAGFGRRSTMLVLCAHGSGLDDIRNFLLALGRGERPLPPPLFHGFFIKERWGPDPRTQRFLTNVSIRDAIAGSELQRVDVLGFNSCLMAMLEIDHELRDVAGVIVACQVDAQVWPYGDIIGRLVAAPTQSAEQLAGAIVGAVRAELDAGTRDDAVSAFRAGDRVAAISDAVGSYARRVTALIDTQWTALRDAVVNSVRGVNDPLGADLALMVIAAAIGDAQAEQAAAQVIAALDAARIDNVADPSHPGVTGLSIFCPIDVQIDLDAAYSGLAFRTNAWTTFLHKFQATLAAELAQHAPARHGSQHHHHVGR